MPIFNMTIFMFILFSISCNHGVRKPNHVGPVDSRFARLNVEFNKCNGVELELNQECDEPGEKEEYIQLGERIRDNVQKVVSEMRQEHKGKVFRAFHAKKHGCMQGKLVNLSDNEIKKNISDVINSKLYKSEKLNHLNNVDEVINNIRLGIFSKAKEEYPLWARYSNASPFTSKSDSEGNELRGMAIKVMNVSGLRAKNFGEEFKGEKNTQDFLMTNKPFGTTADPWSFVNLGEKLASGNDGKNKRASIGQKVYGIQAMGLKGTGRIALVSLKKVGNLATQKYWSGNAFYLGQNAVKFHVSPCNDHLKKYPPHLIANPKENKIEIERNPDYLKNRLAELSKKSEICFDYKIQFQTDVVRTSIENGLDEWKEKESPSFTIAKILLPKQKIRDDEQNKFCDNLAFNPWHSLEDHKPMGNSGQARFFVYEQSAKGRLDKFYEPNGQEFKNNLIK